MPSPATPPAPPAPAPADAGPAPLSGRRLALALGALLAVAFAVYLPAVDGEFLFDDLSEVMGPLVRAPFDHGVAAWLSTPRPLIAFTFALNDLAVGSDPRGWHLTSVAIHLAAVLVAFALARRTLARAGLASPTGPALAAAAVFALHPLQTEAVAYLSQRAEALAAGLAMLGLVLLLARDEAAAPRRRAALLGGAALALLAGLLCKPTAAVLPAAWLLWAAVLPPPGEQDRPWHARIRARLLPAAPLLALSLGAAVLGLRSAEGSGHAGFQVEGLPPLAYLATQLRVVPRYLGLAAWPVGQRVDWDVDRSAGLLEWPALAGGLFLAGLAGGATWLVAWARARSGDAAAAARAGALGLLYFLLTLTPSSSVVPLADVMAEHRVYPGLLGLALGAAAAAAWALRRAGARAGAGWALALVACGLLAALTADRAAVWRSAVALWRDAAEKSPDKPRPLVNLGVALGAQGRVQEGLEAFRRAQVLDVGHAVPDEILLTNVVDTLAALGRVDEARQAVLAALERRPDAGVALGLLVRVEFAARRYDAAEEAGRRALAVDPGNALAQKFLGMLEARRGDLLPARAHLRGAALAAPQDGTIQWELGRVEQAVGDVAAACLAFRRAAAGSGVAAVAARAAAAAAALGCP